jgi:hypothetical protein
MTPVFHDFNENLKEKRKKKKEKRKKKKEKNHELSDKKRINKAD